MLPGIIPTSHLSGSHVLTSTAVPMCNETNEDYRPLLMEVFIFVVMQPTASFYMFIVRGEEKCCTPHHVWA